MEKYKAIFYIGKRISRSRARDPWIDSAIAGKNRESRVDDARGYAERGMTTATANNLFHDDILAFSQKGEILAMAYAKDAENTTKWAAWYRGDPDFKKELIMRAQRLKLTAQGLALAAKRTQ